VALLEKVVLKELPCEVEWYFWLKDDNLFVVALVATEWACLLDKFPCHEGVPTELLALGMVEAAVNQKWMWLALDGEHATHQVCLFEGVLLLLMLAIHLMEAAEELLGVLVGIDWAGLLEGVVHLVSESVGDCSRVWWESVWHSHPPDRVWQSITTGTMWCATAVFSDDILDCHCDALAVITPCHRHWGGCSPCLARSCSALCGVARDEVGEAATCDATTREWP
jgi:hypothetical protein